MANKSQAIRDYATAHPQAGPKEIAQALAKDKIAVTAAYVSTVLFKHRRGPQPRSKVKQLTMAQMKAAKQFVADCGGVKEAEDAFVAFVDLMS